MWTENSSFVFRGKLQIPPAYSVWTGPQIDCPTGYFGMLKSQENYNIVIKGNSQLNFVEIVKVRGMLGKIKLKQKIRRREITLPWWVESKKKKTYSN